MSAELLRVYFDPAEVRGDGYPFAWSIIPGEEWHGIKDLIREQAGHRCERCLHPYAKGMGEWSPCDDQCRHGGPIRYRDGAHDDWRERAVIPTAAAEARLDELPHGTGVRWDVEAAWRILTVHHLNGVKHDCRWWNLVALCQRCHLTIQGKVHLERPWNRPHSDWFRPYVAGYYASEGILLYDTGGEPPREWVMEHMDEILAAHETQPALLEPDRIY